MRIDDLPDLDQPGRRVMNFDSLGIDCLIRLGEVCNNASCPPLGRHVHRDSFEAVFFQTGSQNYSTDTAQYTVNSGEMFLSLPNEPHSSGRCLEEKSRFFYFIFSLPASSCLPGFSPEETDQARALLSSVGEQRVFPVPRQVFPRMKQLLDLYFSQRPFRRALIQSAASELLCAVLAALTPAEPASARNGTLETLKAYIDQNLFRRITAEELAQYAHFSKSRVHQLFRESGLTLHDYILRRKIETAKELLSRTDLTVTEIAYRLDFSTSQHFATVFARYLRQSPTAYRKSRQSAPLPEKDGETSPAL